MAIRQFFFLTLIIFISGCHSETNKIELKDDSAIKETNKKAENGLPPFTDTCLCTFQKFGVYKISNSNFNIYYCGKGWNPECNSCTFSWGEIVYNENPNDTSVTFIKIHLLDLEKFNLPSNMTVYGNDTIKKYVIAVCTYDYRKNERNCIYDPFNTGKYKRVKTNNN